MQVTNKRIEKMGRKLKQKRKELEESQLNAVRELLSNEFIEETCVKNHYEYRKRLITPVVITFHMIQAALSQESSFQSAWQYAGQTGQSGTLSKARKRLPLQVWQNMDISLVRKIQSEFDRVDQWHGHRLIGIDGSGVSMSDEKALTAAYGKTKSNYGTSRFPTARVAFAFTLGSFLTVAHQIAPYKIAEQTLFKKITETLLPGDLLVGDQHLAGANQYADNLKRGLDFITPAHHSLKMKRLKVIEHLGHEEAIVELPVSKKYQRTDPSMPQTVIVRILKIKRQQKEFWLITSLLDPKKYPSSDIKALYKRRWKVETLIGEIKLWLGADILRSKTVEGIQKEFTSRIITFNLIHWLILKAAKKHLKNSQRISTSATVRLTVSYSLKMSTAPVGYLGVLYERFLALIAASTVPYWPGRIEPRMKKRGRKHFPELKISRTEWKRIHGLAA